MTIAETADFCVRVLYRASKDAWICGDDAEAERLAALAHKTRLDMTPTTKEWTVTQLLQNSIDFWHQIAYIIGMNKKRSVPTPIREELKKDLPPVVSEEELLEGVNQIAKTWGLDRNYTKVTQPLSFKNVN